MVLSFLVLLLALSHSFTDEKRTCFFTREFIIHVINDLPPNTPGPNSSLPLGVHCSSKDDDLGYHSLSAHDDFHWDFCEDYLFRTVFSCSLWWGDVYSKTFIVFSIHVAYNCERGVCNWVAKNDGIYFSGNRDPKKDLIRMYPWDATE